jgi:hypothetical protein
MNPVIVFASYALKFFNIKQEYSLLITPTGNQIVSIPFDTTHGYSFEVWDWIQFFLHASFSDAKYNYICKNNELYHKLAKQYHLLSDSFDVCFSHNGTILMTPEYDFFALELTFKYA